MDAKADEEEISRLKAMPALIELQPHEENDYNNITTKMVITWKKRRRKAVGSEEPDVRQFRWSIDVKDSSPHVLMAIQGCSCTWRPAAPSTAESSMSRMLS